LNSGFADNHADAREPLMACYRQIRGADWATPADAKRAIGSASILNDGRAVFNIAGNKYRIVVWINYPYRIVYVRCLGSLRTAVFRKDMMETKVVEENARICYLYFMNRDEAISRLQQHEADLKRLGVERLYMFGSTARGEARDDSDVDLFFDYEKGKLGLFELMDVKEYAAGIIGRKTDIMTRDSLHKTLRPKIESTAVRVF